MDAMTHRATPFDGGGNAITPIRILQFPLSAAIQKLATAVTKAICGTIRQFQELNCAVARYVYLRFREFSITFSR